MQPVSSVHSRKGDRDGAAGASAQVFDYPGSGHLFTDPSIPGEYDEQAAALLWHRALAFCRSPHD